MTAAVSTSGQSTPYLSVVIPIYNEEGILREAVAELQGKLDEIGWRYQIILAENGSTDTTVSLAEHLAEEADEISVLSIGEPNYGRALRQGILRARGAFVICDEIDLCDIDFYRRAMDLLEHGDADLVVGSKAMKGAQDRRPAMRRAATRVINGMLRVAVGFRGTDTHGLKAFRRTALESVVEACVVDKDLFASEFVIRAGRMGKRVVEIPVRVAEKRRPAINLARRVPHVLTDLAKLTYVIRIKR
jgi:glycosyltransferase involved in cell wall biosynthesis